MGHRRSSFDIKKNSSSHPNTPALPSQTARKLTGNLVGNLKGIPDATSPPNPPRQAPRVLATDRHRFAPMAEKNFHRKDAKSAKADKEASANVERARLAEFFLKKNRQAIVHLSDFAFFASLR
jgi:hypothetical protein